MKTPEGMIKNAARAGMLWLHRNQAQDELVTQKHQWSQVTKCRGEYYSPAGFNERI